LPYSVSPLLYSKDIHLSMAARFR